MVSTVLFFLRFAAILSVYLMIVIFFYQNATWQELRERKTWFFVYSAPLYDIIIRRGTTIWCSYVYLGIALFFCL